MIWRIKCTIAILWILRDSMVGLGFAWKISGKINRDLPPYQAALEEITRWYFE